MIGPMSENNSLPPLVVENHRRLLEILTPHAASPQGAEDILHAMYARGYEKGGELKETDRMIPWLGGLLRDAMVIHGRSPEAKLSKPPPLPDPAADGAIRGCVEALLATLKPEQAKVIRKVEFENRSLKDLAHMEKTAPEVIAVRLHRAREALKKKVLQTFGLCATHSRIDCSCPRPVSA